MNYEHQKDLIDALNKVISEQSEAIKCQKGMIKNLCEAHLKTQVPKKYKVPELYLN